MFERALYLNNVNTMFLCDLDDPETFGFGSELSLIIMTQADEEPENQVTPFSVTTPDGQILHAWHILPRALYAKHESEVKKLSLEKVNIFKETFAYKLLSEDPEARLIINCK
jgi:abhydrolase domain-containing protein 12